MSFEKNNFWWQLSQWQQRISEWWELKTSHLIPKIRPFPWLDYPLLWQAIQIICWLIIAGLLIWAVLKIWQKFRPYLYQILTQNQLPNQVPEASINHVSTAGWLQRAQKFKQQANYREACRCLYMATLQQLNDRQLVPHQLSRTDREYLQSIQNLPHPQPYELLLLTHEQLYFGNTQASLSLFEQCQQAYQQIKDEKLSES